MRTLIPILSLLLAASAAQAAGPGCTDPVSGDLGCGCRTCGQGCGWHRRPWRYEGLDPCFNCGCNGSYKFPAPPLYSYHWPGMYSAQWMTEYRSPWRYPPLRPYTDETPSAMEQTAGEIEPLSSKLLR